MGALALFGGDDAPAPAPYFHAPARVFAHVGDALALVWTRAVDGERNSRRGYVSVGLQSVQRKELVH